MECSPTPRPSAAKPKCGTETPKHKRVHWKKSGRGCQRVFSAASPSFLPEALIPECPALHWTLSLCNICSTCCSSARGLSPCTPPTCSQHAQQQLQLSSQQHTRPRFPHFPLKCWYKTQLSRKRQPSERGKKIKIPTEIQPSAAAACLRQPHLMHTWAVQASPTSHNTVPH